MRYVTDNRLFNAVLLFTIIGEFLLPCILERYDMKDHGNE